MADVGYLHFMKWPLASRQVFGLTLAAGFCGHLTNLPDLSRHGLAAIDGLAAAPNRLSADKASTSFFMSSLPSAWGKVGRTTVQTNSRCQPHYNIGHCRSPMPRDQ